MSVRQIRIEGDLAYVPLTQGYEAVIDSADVHLVEGYNWKAHVERRRNGQIRAVYAIRLCGPCGARRNVRLHRVIAQTPDGYEADHIDGDGLNNRRSNLRNATRAQNARNLGLSCKNRSGIKGVSLHKPTNKWRARIKVCEKEVSLGYFDDPSEAAAAYARASESLHGAFGRVA